MIGFAGLSHLGLVTGISVASKGFDVVGFDSDEGLVATLNTGKLPVHEPQLPELLGKSQGRIRFTSSAADLAACEVVFVAPDVATNDENISDLRPLQGLIDRVTPHLKRGATLVLHSQVPPGFTRPLRKKLAPLGIEVFYQVETLVFGRAVERALQPERFMVGFEDVSAALPQAYAQLLGSYDCPLLRMRYESAELCKISINMYLISSVTVTNMLAEICSKVGADWSEIAPALRLDRRIGQHAYLSPGLGLSGGNLERDLATIRRVGYETGADVSPAEAFQRDSAYRADWVLRTLRAEVLAKVPQPVLALWGLAYKPNTKSLKNSPSLRLLRQLQGISVRAYDPQVDLGPGFPSVTQVRSPLEACRGVHALVLMTPWEEFRSVSPAELEAPLAGGVIIDPFGLFAEGPRPASLRYFRLGAEGDR